MTVYITKYALTQGILKREAISTDFHADGYLHLARVNWPADVFGSKDWTRSFVEARAKAERMRKAKIASLSKQIAKLEAMSFLFEEIATANVPT